MTFDGNTVTTAALRSIKLRDLEKRILRNLVAIQHFIVYNGTGPRNPAHALYQRQRYQIIRENCDITTRKVYRALPLTDDDSARARAYHGIFLTLKEMLKNETIRTDEMNNRALNFWNDTIIPEPPLPKPAAAHMPPETHVDRLELNSDTSSEITSDTNDDTSAMYSPTYINTVDYTKTALLWWSMISKVE